MTETQTSIADEGDDEDRLLSRREVEARFGIPKRFLELASPTGQGPREVRLGRSVRYRIRDVRAWLDIQARSESEN